MRFLTIYYEREYNDAYFSEQVRQIVHLFNISRLKLHRIERIDPLTSIGPSIWPRIFLVHQYITSIHGDGVRLDGLSLRTNNFAVVRYQKSMRDTLYVLTHEIGHLLGLPHCNSRNCVMGIQFQDGRISYALWRFASRRMISKNLFCNECTSRLSHRPLLSRNSVEG